MYRFVRKSPKDDTALRFRVFKQRFARSKFAEPKLSKDDIDLMFKIVLSTGLRVLSSLK